MSRWFISGDLAAKIEYLLDRLLLKFPEQKKINWHKVIAAQWTLQGLESLIVKSDAMVPGSSYCKPSIGVTLDDILGCETQKQKLVKNVLQFINGIQANNVLLWGARGTGKSSLVRAILHEFSDRKLRLIEVSKEALVSLHKLSDRIANEPYYFIIYCDDLSFSEGDDHYKALKSALEGSIFPSAKNVIIIATSNRRHLVDEYQDDNRQVEMCNGQLHYGDVIEEKLSLSDRFGIWLSFYPVSQQGYLEIVGYWANKLLTEYYQAKSATELKKLPALTCALESLRSELFRKEALKWALQKGSRSGRTANQFAVHWIGEWLLQTMESKTSETLWKN